MSTRACAKRIAWGLWPRGNLSFPYFGSRVHFPRDSLIFRLACESGIYEPQIVNLVNRLLAPNSVYLDVGANIGLMSVAALASRPDCRVISVEASPATLTHLNRTHAANSSNKRWTIVPTALGRRPGEATFYEGTSQGGAMDGLRDTGRGGKTQGIKVPVTTLDQVWIDLGRPNISAIKIDIEGGERDALAGAEACLSALHPSIVLEWSRLNLPSYGVAECWLLEFAKQYGYSVFSVPGYAEVRSAIEISLRMLETETFVLVAPQAPAFAVQGNSP